LREKEAQLEAEHLKDAEEAEVAEEKKSKKEKRGKKDKKQKLVESNDSKLDREIAERERKLREENAEANGDDQVMEDVEEKKSKKSKKEKKETKDKKPKLVESNDAKLDREIAERERKLREQNAEANGDEDAMDGVEVSKPQYIKSTQHWNTMHLSGGPERQDKFARLLGAKKEEKQLSPEDEAKEKKKLKKRAREAEKAEEAKAAELAKVQRDLEMQYEAGMKLKHDGGSKRRGLGA
jgi:hypothetical protein